ncbi:trans-aconitate 2-methyltransferase [Actinotalea sp. K2]|uniref:class I SAM-dependent methyltransferase n=1 Tax=Actinotalea sp. K2 TaxID=2939438 RepID=UPI00201804FA|nr:class I SAM-dependent methyltransferase [Actinotalea sp. K2]MCL3859418.1 class I SAM-dependent methyltransferase [Actinotalea sp. K2]
MDRTAHPRTAQHHAEQHAGHDEAGLADLLDLDAQALGTALDELVDWVATLAPDAPRTVLDLGAGTGTGTLALTRRFEHASVVAIDSSALMLTRVEAAARRDGVRERVRTVLADLDETLPPTDEVQVAWASSSLHHVADPDRLLRRVHDALVPGGVLAVLEIESMPRFLPHDIGFGRPGLEDRCHAAVEASGWNAYPDWRPYLERAGLEVVGRYRVDTGTRPVPSSTPRYAHSWLGRLRSALGDLLDADDRTTLDRLLAQDDPAALLHRPDLTSRGSRIAWAARRPLTEESS